MQEQQIQHNHSPKTLQTITLMGTKPADWGIVPFTVREETRDMLLPVQCGECHGRGVIYDPLMNVDGEMRARHAVFEMLEHQVRADYPHLSDYQVKDAFFKGEFHSEGDDSSKWFRDEPLFTVYGWSKVNGGRRGRYGSSRCPICPQKRSRRGFNMGTGIVMQFFENVPVNAHYPSWPAGTQFTSRFPRGAGGCEACGKCGIKSGEFPVGAINEDGQFVGMFVGNACLKKFGFKQFKSVDEQAKSWDIRKARGDESKWVTKGEGRKDKDLIFGKRVIDLYIRSRKDLGALDAVTSEQEVVEEVVEEAQVVSDEVVEVKEIQVISKGFDCPHCSKTYGSRQGRYNHIRKHHA